MPPTWKSRRALLGLLGAGAIIAGGAVGGAALAGSPPDDVSYDQYLKAANPDYEKNARGLTYGSVAEANVPEEEPDLILVVADDGEKGYIYGDDLNPPDFKSPEEAAAWTKARSASPVILDVFKSDGVTKIGTFTLTSSQ